MQLFKHCSLVTAVVLLVAACSGADDAADDPVSPEQAALTADEMVGYPGATRIPAHPARVHQSRPTSAIKRIVIHALTGYAKSTIETWKANRESRGIAAHYVVDRTGKVVQTVSDVNVAYQIQNNNSNTIGIEHEDAVKINGNTRYYDDNPDWATEEELLASAKLTAWLCKTYDIPCDRTHVFGHAEVQTSIQNGPVRPGCWDYGWGRPQGADRNRPECQGNHSDPGRYFDWKKYMDLVGTARDELAEDH